MRKLTYALAALVGFVGTKTLVRPLAPLSLAQLSGGAARMPVRMWFVFDPLSCRLSPDVVRRLNTLAVGTDTEFVGVMLDAPADGPTFARITKAFGMRFRVIPDPDGKWRRATQSADIPTPFVVVRNQGRLSGIISLLNYQIIPDSIADAIHKVR